MKLLPSFVFCPFVAVLTLFSPARADTLFITGNGAVEQYTSEGASLGDLGDTAASGANQMVRDADGNFYVGNYYTGGIDKYSPSGTPLLSIPQDIYPDGLTIGPDGNLFATGRFRHDSSVDLGIERFSTTGADLGLFAPVGGDEPNQMAFDSAGNLYLSFGKRAGIEKYSSTGTDLGVFADTAGQTADGLAFDSRGNLYVSYPFGNKIEEFSASGLDLGAFATDGLARPGVLAFDASGDLYVGNLTTASLEEFSPAGTELNSISLWNFKPALGAGDCLHAGTLVVHILSGWLRTAGRSAQAHRFSHRDDREFGVNVPELIESGSDVFQLCPSFA